MMSLNVLYIRCPEHAATTRRGYVGLGESSHPKLSHQSGFCVIGMISLYDVLGLEAYIYISNVPGSLGAKRYQIV